MKTELFRLIIMLKGVHWKATANSWQIPGLRHCYTQADRAVK